MAKLKQGQPVHIVWRDSHFFGGSVWVDKEQAAELALPEIHALGFIIADESDRLVLAGHIGGGLVASVMSIPRSCIVQVTKLTQVKNV